MFLLCNTSFPHHYHILHTSPQTHTTSVTHHQRAQQCFSYVTHHYRISHTSLQTKGHIYLHIILNTTPCGPHITRALSSLSPIQHISPTSLPHHPHIIHTSPQTQTTSIYISQGRSAVFLLCNTSLPHHYHITAMSVPHHKHKATLIYTLS